MPTQVDTTQQTAPSVSDVVEILNADGAGSVVLVCEHASNRIPARYGTLGLSPEARASHIAWDPGAREVALRLMEILDAPLIAGRVSRLVYDCNRPPDSPAASPERSERFDVPGNRDLSETQRHDRRRCIYEPFRARVEAVIKERLARGSITALVTIHSFTPIYNGVSRPVEIGVIHDADTRLTDANLAEASKFPHRRIERNAPYSKADGVTHSLRLYGEENDLPNAMIEIRNDLLIEATSRDEVSQEIGTLVQNALDHLGLATVERAHG